MPSRADVTPAVFCPWPGALKYMTTWRPRLMLRSGVAELGAMRGLINAHGALDAFGPGGDGPPVLLIPGFLAGDQSLEPLARHLTAAGYRRSRRASSAMSTAPSAPSCASRPGWTTSRSRWRWSATAGAGCSRTCSHSAIRSW